MANRPGNVLAKKKARSRLSNGHALPRNVDHRSAWARRFRDLLQIHLSDLGGVDNASASEQAIARRACTLILSLEMMEMKFAMAGEASPADLEIYQRCASSMRRLLEAVGLQRRSRDVTPPHPLDYAADFDARRAAS
jgi:hypothetical protein